MDSITAVDVASMDLDLLQLPELLMPSSLKPNPYKGHIDEIFFSLPETGRLVMSLVEEAKAGVPLNAPSGSCNANLGVSSPLLPSMFPARSAPPLSPRSSSGSFSSPRAAIRRLGAGPSCLGFGLKWVSEPVKELIPQFYFPKGPPPPKEMVEECLSKIDKVFQGHSYGLHISEFVSLVTRVYKLPSFFSSSLFKKIDADYTGFVTRFKCVDLDDNGIITPNEMQFFYEEQLHRMECMAQEPVLFEDILCQLVDMICPEKEWQLTLHDLKHSELSGIFFNILFNLSKFMAFETRDPFLIRQEREDPTLTEWDRFAHQEYIRLSMEEDGEDASNGSVEIWDDSLDVPF